MKKSMKNKISSFSLNGKLLGVYFENEYGDEILLGLPPEEADKLIKFRRKKVKREKKLLSRIKDYLDEFEKEFGIPSSPDTWEEEAYMLLSEVKKEFAN